MQMKIGQLLIHGLYCPFNERYTDHRLPLNPKKVRFYTCVKYFMVIKYLNVNFTILGLKKVVGKKGDGKKKKSKKKKSSATAHN